MKSLRALNKYLWKYRWHLGLGLIFIIVSDLYGVWSQVYIREGVNAIAGYENELNKGEISETTKREFFEVILSCILMFFGYNLIKGFFLFCQRQTIIVMSRRIEYDLKNSIYKHYQELPASFYQKGNTGDIMNRISEDVSKVRMYLGPGIMYTINLVVLLVITITQMLKVNAELTLYVLTPLPIMTWLVFTISNRINNKSTMVQEKQSELSSRAQEDFSSIRLIRTFGQSLFSSWRFNARTDDYRQAGESLLRTEAAFIPVMTLLVGLSTLLTICIGGIQCINGKISIGNIPEFVLYVNMLTWPFASVGWISSLISKAAASQERINEFLNEIPITEKMEKGERIEKNFGSIVFNDVSFSYAKNPRKAISNISFTLQQGKTLGIIGRTGSGKTTIANLLNAQQTGYEGTIHIGRHELQSIALNDLHDKISCVPQEAFLFSDSISNNIAFGSKEKTPAQSTIEQYAQKAAVHDNIMLFEKKYETVVGERGITLSGGQKQRITIARSLIRDPEILIFDDCMSAVDAETEKEILGNLIKEMKGKTTILISHRVSTVMYADEIIVLEDGKITEQGKHNDLLKNKGLYAMLYAKQSGTNQPAGL